MAFSSTIPDAPENAPVPDAAFATAQDVTDEVARLREEILDKDDALARLESQHDVLENFVFGLEREHEQARLTIEATQAELVASYDRLRLLKEQQDDILANVRQGIITLRADGVINAEYSRATESIFERTALGGTRFCDLFPQSMNVSERLESYLRLLFDSPHAHNAMIRKLNPIAECRFPVERSFGTKVKMLSFSFVRIFAEGDGSRRVEKLMVVIDDRTKEFELARELERRTREQAARVEKLYQILALPSDAFANFIREVEDALRTLETKIDALQKGSDRASQIRVCTRITHTLKGNATALGLDALASSAHALEDLLARIPIEPLPDASDERATWTDVQMKFTELEQEVRDGHLLFEKLLNVKASLQRTSNDRLAEVCQTLRALLESEGQRLGIAPELQWRNDLPEAPPPHIVLRIRNVLVQLVRNSLAHGIESETERTQIGKPKTGRIDIVLRHEDSAIVLVYRDDGRGIDAAALQEKAVAKSLVPPPRLSDAPATRALDLIFVPGLSTSNTVGELSGRGIGMDVVREHLEAVGGTIDVASTPLRSTEFTMRIPLQHSHSREAGRKAKG